jgi:CHAT domain-containing protein/tetratricopeptide (TPR) repeat protein
VIHAEKRKQLLTEAQRLWAAGRYAEALPQFSQCLPLFSEKERSGAEFADFCGNFGSVLAETGNLKLAEKMLTIALQLYREADLQSDLARTHLNLGNVYRYMNWRQACSDHYRKALEIYRARGDSHGLGLCQLQLANFYAEMGVYDLVREQLEEIEKLSPDAKQDPEFRWSWRFQQAKVAVEDHQPERALALLEEALVCARQTKIPDYIEQTESAIGRIRRGPRARDALPQLEHAYATAKSRNDRSLFIRTYELAQALAAEGVTERAAVLYGECLDSMDIGRGNLDGVERFYWMERLASVSQEFSAHLFRQDRHKKSLEASERGQGRVLLDLMFRHQIKLQGERAIRMTSNGRVILDSPTWEEIQSALRAANTHLLKILQTPKCTLAWLVTPDGDVDSWEIPSQAALERMIGLLTPTHGEDSPTVEDDLPEVRAERPAARVPWEVFKRALADLYEELAPARVRSLLETQHGRLLIVPHCSYFHVPWGALGSVTGPILSANWQICVTPSVGVFMQLDRQRDPRAWRGLLDFQIPVVSVGGCGPQKVTFPALPVPNAPALSLSFSDLPGTREEAQRVAELLGGVMLVGPQAHPVAVRKFARIGGVLHLATHGYWHMVAGDLSFLVFASPPVSQPGKSSDADGAAALFTHQIMADNFSTSSELVTLSGCQTGLGSSHPDTYINLAHSFLVAGARSVLVSLWPIRDDAAVAFMEEFYTELRNGRSPSEALQSAQEQLSKSVLWNDCWNWCGFAVVGNSFHGFAPEQGETKFSGPAFAAGDFLYEGGADGAKVPLQDFVNERQTSDQGWFVRDGKIVKIPKY